MEITCNLHDLDGEIIGAAVIHRKRLDVDTRIRSGANPPKTIVLDGAAYTCCHIDPLRDNGDLVVEYYQVDTVEVVRPDTAFVEKGTVEGTIIH